MIVVELLIRGSVLFGAAGLATLLLRNRSAGVRHWVWTLAMAAALVLPLSSGRGPELLLPVLPAAGAVETGVPETAGGWVGDSELGTPLTSEPLASKDHGFGLAWWAFGLWLCGGILLLLRFSAGSVRAFRVLRRARPTSVESWLGSRGDWTLRGNRSIDLRISNEIEIPATLGLRGAVLMPESSWEWPSEQRWMALLHETTHVRRRDYVSHVVGRLARIVHWPNPLAWFAERRLLFEREAACDDAVLCTGVDRFEYGSHLLAVAGGSIRSRTRWAGLSLIMKSEIRTRLIGILSARTRVAAISRPARFGVLVSVAGVWLFASAAEPVRRTLSAEAEVPLQQVVSEPNYGALVGSWRLPVSDDASVDLSRTNVDVVFESENPAESRVELYVRGLNPNEREELLEELGFRFTISGRKSSNPDRTVTVVSQPLSSRWQDTVVTAVIWFPSDAVEGIPDPTRG